MGLHLTNQSPSTHLLSQIAEHAQATLAVLQAINERFSLLVAGQLDSATEWLSIKQAATVSGLSQFTVRRAVKSGDLKASNPGGSLMRPTYRIQRADLEAFMQQYRATGSGLPALPRLKVSKKSPFYGD